MSRGKMNKGLRPAGSRRMVSGELPTTIKTVAKFQKVYSSSERHKMAMSQEALYDSDLFPWLIQDDNRTVTDTLARNNYLRSSHVEVILQEFIKRPHTDVSIAFLLSRYHHISSDVLDKVMHYFEMPKTYIGHGDTAAYRWWAALLTHPNFSEKSLADLVDADRDDNKYVIDYILLMRPAVLGHKHLKKFIQNINMSNAYSLKIIFAHAQFDQELLELLPKRADLPSAIEGVVMRHKRELPRKYPERFSPLPPDPKPKPAGTK